MRVCANHHYYFRVGLGHWQGEFGFRVLDWRKWWLDSIGPVNRFLVVLMHMVIRILGNASITSILRPQDENKVSNEVRITKFGLALYTLTEEYILDADCTHVWVRSRERFGPIPFVFNRKKEHPAEIHEGGTRAVYFIPLLGTDWVGEYTVSADAQHIHSVLHTFWAEATEAITRRAPRYLRPAIDRTTPAGRVHALAADLYPYHERYEAAHDARAVFAYAYYNMTASLAIALEHGAAFQSPDWVATLAEKFASRYRAAMDAIDEQRWEAVPQPWRDVYHATARDSSYVLEDLVFSMMAHISHDLPLALQAIGATASEIADYHLMNDVLAKDIDLLQDEIAERYQSVLADLDQLAGRFDEFLTNYGIRTARGVAWYNSVRLTTDPVGATASITRSTALLIDAVCNPDSWWVRTFIHILRRVLPPRRRWPRKRLP